MLIRIRDTSGQAILWVLLVLGALMALFIGGVGLGEGHLGQATLQTVADAAADAAAQTAVPVVSATVTESAQTCKQRVNYDPRTRTFARTQHCSAGARRQVNVLEAASDFASGGWAAAAGCSAGAPPPDFSGTWIECMSYSGEATGRWLFPSTGAAEAAAQGIVQANMPQVGRLGAVSLAAFSVQDGSGQAKVVLRLDEAHNPLNDYVRIPVVLTVVGTAYPHGAG